MNHSKDHPEPFPSTHHVRSAPLLGGGGRTETASRDAPRTPKGTPRGRDTRPAEARDRLTGMRAFLVYLWWRTGGETPFCSIVKDIWDPATIRYPDQSAPEQLTLW